MITNTNERENFICDFYYDIRNKRKIGLSHLKSSGVSLPYNIYYVNETHAYIEISVAGYARNDISVYRKVDVISVTTAYHSSGIPVDTNCENIHYSTPLLTSDDDLNNKFYVYKGLTNKEFTMDFHIPTGHKISTIKIEDGVLIIEVTLTEELWDNSEHLF